LFVWGWVGELKEIWKTYSDIEGGSTTRHIANLVAA
jgi:hypothetical protein